MNGMILCLSLAGALGAQAPMHIVGVERHGPPPYEQSDRIYVVDGAQALHVGERLLVKRPGEAAVLGVLRVATRRADRAEARFEPTEATFPMKGDLVFQAILKVLPPPASIDPEPIPRLATPKPTAEAPPQEGLLFFLPQRADLSLAGVKKLEAWVEAWGTEGRWVLQVPKAKALKPALQKQRAEAILQALRTLGIEKVALESPARTSEGKYDPTWLQHWD
jgi:hypothetical protein